jgi:RecB family exonuclease
MRGPQPADEGRVGQEAGVVVLRGTVDCLIVRADGSVLVLEFKTGSPRPSHQRQLDVYLDAARALFPGAPVSGQLIYG